jgi:SAM-dependent methyltransferase
MRSVLRGRDADIRVVEGTAEATGLPDGCADIVTASQAMHWFDPARTLPEVVRLLRPGGVFAAYDCDWPPCVHPEVDRAYSVFERRQWHCQEERGLRPGYADKEGHLGRMRESGLFTHAREICLHSVETGDAERLVSVANTQGGTVALLADGVTEDELGLTALREIAARHLAEPVPWWWTYRVRLGVK